MKLLVGQVPYLPYHCQCPCYSTINREIFTLLNFCKNGDFNNFAKNISANEPLGNIKGVAWQYFCKIRENKATRKFPGTVYGSTKC